MLGFNRLNGFVNTFNLSGFRRSLNNPVDNALSINPGIDSNSYKLLQYVYIYLKSLLFNRFISNTFFNSILNSRGGSI